VLAGQEVVVVANTNYSQPFPNGAVLVDLDLNRNGRQMRMAYSNCGTALAAAVAVSIGPGRVYQDDGTVKSAAELASLPVSLDAMEVQIFVPA
jgi:hypothetical protein